MPANFVKLRLSVLEKFNTSFSAICFGVWLSNVRLCRSKWTVYTGKLELSAILLFILCPSTRGFAIFAQYSRCDRRINDLLLIVISLLYCTIMLANNFYTHGNASRRRKKNGKFLNLRWNRHDGTATAQADSPVENSAGTREAFSLEKRRREKKSRI